MLQSTGVALMMGFWASLYLLDAFLKSHRLSSRVYNEFLLHTGISVSVAQVRWFTSCMNRLFLRLGSWRPQLLKAWFNCGVCFGLVAMLLSICLLTLLVVNTLFQNPVENQVLTPVMPGINLPMNQIAYYLLTLFVCGVLHEVGHAVAAVREQVKVNGFGIFILILYPGAFVDLYTEHLRDISPLRQLRIYCAGVWHNFVIVIVALFILTILPWLLVPFYHTGSSVILTSVVQNSAVSGPRGLHVGDRVTSISGCRITSRADWVQCIQVSMNEPSLGYCMTTDMLQQQDISINPFMTALGNMDCCGNTTNTHLCFFYHSKTAASLKYTCLPGRSTSDRHPCRLQSDCKVTNTPSVCVMPSLDNSTKLLRVMHSGRPPLLFVGHPLDLHYAVTLSDYVPNSSLIPIDLPYVVDTFCKYLISLSGALAILNVVPCYALDGQWILHAFIELGLGLIISDREIRNLIYSVLLLFGTILLSTNIVIAMWTLFFR